MVFLLHLKSAICGGWAVSAQNYFPVPRSELLQAENKNNIIKVNVKVLWGRSDEDRLRVNVFTI